MNSRRQISRHALDLWGCQGEFGESLFTRQLRHFGLLILHFIKCLPKTVFGSVWGEACVGGGSWPRSCLEQRSLGSAPCPTHPRVSVSGTQQAVNKYLRQELLHTQAALVFPFSLLCYLRHTQSACPVPTEPKVEEKPGFKKATISSGDHMSCIGRSRTRAAGVRNPNCTDSPSTKPHETY